MHVESQMAYSFHSEIFFHDQLGVTALTSTQLPEPDPFAKLDELAENAFQALESQNLINSSTKLEIADEKEILRLMHTMHSQLADSNRGQVKNETRGKIV
jgi:hypothetical protein